MEKIFVQTTLNKNDLKKIIRKKLIGRDSKPLAFQPPMFKDKPLIFCSHICEGYQDTYGDREGILFETDSSIVYASPTDTFNFLRGGKWLPGHEKFLFDSLDKMLEKYPTTIDFKKDFVEYFKKLTPKKVYPELEKNYARIHYSYDYCFSPKWNPGCNEIAFLKPLKIQNFVIFDSREELEKILTDLNQ